MTEKERRLRLSTIGLVLLIVSMLLCMAAIYLKMDNFDKDRQAAKRAGEILNEWEDMTLKTDHDGDLVRGMDFEPEYIAVLKIPVLDITLPVNADWSEEAAEISPCRYQGSITGSNLIIAGHNYESHFGALKNLQPGDDIYLIDAAEKKHYYKVVGIETINGTDTTGMQSGDWDLTLFTCDYMGANRITVRCQSSEM